MTTLRHFNDTPGVRFITFSTHDRIPLFSDPSLADIAMDGLKILSKEFQISILSFVVMPDHLHLVLFPPAGLDVGRAVGRYKALAALTIVERLKSVTSPLLPQLEINRNEVKKYAVWTRRCYDHNCRSRNSVAEKIAYCHNNPVARRLVSEPESYRWSSIGWYNGEGDLPVRIYADW